jgi:hypothetical protein
MKIKISSEKDEMSATIIKGLLKANNIKAYIAAGNDSLNLNPQVSKGPNVTFSIFVEEEDVNNAKKILETK